jgi:hypothetical protein
VTTKPYRGSARQLTTIDKGVPALSYLTANVMGEMHGQIFGYVYNSTQHTVGDTVIQGWNSSAMVGSVVDW